MLDVLTGFVEELRAAGLEISITEAADAGRAVHEIDMSDRDALEVALGSTLVKSHAHWKVFKTVFEIYFARRHGAQIGAERTGSLEDDIRRELAGPVPSHAMSAGEYEPLTGTDGAIEALGELSEAELSDAALRALEADDEELVRLVASYAVSRYGGMQPGRPVGGVYYLYRTLRALQVEALEARLMEGELSRTSPSAGAIERRLARDAVKGRIERLRQAIESEIRRRLVADRGAKALAKSVRRPLITDVDVMHATAEELEEMRRVVRPLSRKLAVRLAKRHRHTRKGPLDFRATVRRSLSTGGVPVQPSFRAAKPAKPEIVVLADISGSVATFARFTLQLVHSVASHLRGVRSFVFVDGIDEVTKLIEGHEDVSDAVRRISTEADVMWVDGHSDYGHAFTVFLERWGECVGPKTTLMVLGDARNNYHASQSWVLAELSRRARAVYWLDPEPRAYWGTGDSIVAEYGAWCDAVVECRNLRQLEDFVGKLSEKGKVA